MEQPSFQSFAKRAKQYWWIDGLPEIGFGTEMLLLALYFFLMEQIQSETWSILAASIGLPMLFVATFYGISKLVMYLKKKITFPRTGYVRYPERQPASRRRRMLIGGVIGLLTAMLINLSLAFFGVNAQWMVIALIMMMSMVYIGYLVSVFRYYVMGVLSLLWGMSMIWMPLDANILYACFFCGVGIIFCISGLVVLMRYLQRYPRSEGDDYAG